MNTTFLDSRRCARMMLGTMILMVVVQVLLAAFRPDAAHARRWGGGYEVQATVYGYILYCEEPRDEIFDPLYASRVWRRTLHSVYGADGREAMRIRDNMNAWFGAITDQQAKSTWLGKRCLSKTGHKPVEFRQVWYYVGLDNTEYQTDVAWARSSLTGVLTQGTSTTP